MKISDYQTDASLEEGVWLDFDDARFLIASMNRPAYQKAQDRARRGISLALIQRDRRVSEKILATALAEACVLGWENVQDETGAQLPCTPENKMKLMKAVAVRDWIAAMASDISNFQHEATAEDAEALKSLPAMESGVGAQ